MLTSNTNDVIRKKTEFMNQLSADPNRFEAESAENVLSLSLETFAPKIAFASSFGAEDVVVIDLMYNIQGDKTRVFTLDTGRLNPETYDVMDKIRKKYSISIETMFPDYLEVEKMVTENGVNLMYNSVENRKMCCRVRKVHPLGRMLKTLDAWITGLRRDQTSTRSAVKKVELDASNNNI